MASLLRSLFRAQQLCSNSIMPTILKSSPSVVCRSSLLARCFSANQMFTEKYDVTPYYGKLKVYGNLDVIINPDLEHQCGSKCTVKLFGPKDSKTQVAVSKIDDIIAIKGIKDKSYDDHDPEYSQHIEISLPVKYDVDAKLMGDANLTVNGLQNQHNTISTQDGNLTVNKLQSVLVDFRTDYGNLNVNHKLLSSLLYLGKTLKLSGDVIQGDSIEMVARDQVDVIMDVVKSKQFKLDTESAVFHVWDFSADSVMKVDEADFRIENASGKLQWDLGLGVVMLGVVGLDADSHMSVGAGECCLAYPPDERYSLSVSAPHINPHPELEKYHEDPEAKTFDVEVKDSNRFSASLSDGEMFVVPWTWPHTDYSVITGDE